MKRSILFLFGLAALAVFLAGCAQIEKSGRSFGGNLSDNLSCTDSDWGLNYYVKGESNGVDASIPSITNYSYEDRCSTSPNERVLMEASCDRQFVVTTAFTCTNGCQDGTCLNQTIPPQLTCTDSDGGLNYYVKGESNGVDPSIPSI